MLALDGSIQCFWLTSWGVLDMNWCKWELDVIFRNDSVFLITVFVTDVPD